MSKDILELFKVMVVDDENKTSTTYTSLTDYGVVTDFVPTMKQELILTEYYKPLDMRTLFSVEERKNASPYDLIVKQVLHYVEVYGLGMPGLFNLEFDGGSIISMNFIKGVTVDELGVMVRKLLETNAPVKDAELVKRVINEYNIEYDINKIANNELRVALFDVQKDTFTSGDDAVRWMCYAATENTLMIKSKEVIAAIKSCAKIDRTFLDNHDVPLAQVFNRHKKLIMAAKNHNTKTVINKISRWSKTRHVPVKESIAKSYVSKAIAGNISADVLSKISVRDRFKFLNLLDYKRMGNTKDAFIIRNGKIHIAEGRDVWTSEQIDRVESDILESLKTDLAHLNDKDILLDSKVHYGLPISRKQTIGNLPFGTVVKNTSKNKLSSGIYWENEWGARDLDLSTIDVSGNRTGWGQLSGYDNSNSVEFSGDVTSAPNGAMEFMTSDNAAYGLFVNIWCGEVGCSTEIVVGTKTDNRWISEPVIREKITLDSKGSLVGFVKGSDFVVYKGKMSDNHISGDREASVVARGTSNFWTVNRLFDAINIKYDVDNDPKRQYSNDISYNGFTYDKLEDLLL